MGGITLVTMKIPNIAHYPADYIMDVHSPQRVDRANILLVDSALASASC